MASNVNIVHSIESLDHAKGGPSYSVTALASAQQRLTSGKVAMVVGSVTGTPRLPDQQVCVSHAKARYLPLRMFETRNLVRNALAGENIVLHDHGIWLPHNLAACGYALRHRRPYVISPRGMLEPWTLGYHPARKKLARWLYQDRLLRNASCLIATADRELASIRTAGFRNPVAVIPNGIDSDIPEPGPATTQGTRTLLFLSRIHPVKGIVHLIEAWQVLRPTGWQLSIVGPDEGNYRSTLQDLVAKHDLQHQIHFHDAVKGEAKYRCYQSADAFVLPTYSENFGLVIAEALACGLPVITTNGTPWRGLIQHRCGWYIDTGTETLVSALRDVFAAAPEMLREMGQRGRSWMQSEFQWPAIAASSLAVYEWILGQRDQPPSCVDLCGSALS